MITIRENSSCCGCQACFAVCPARCISMMPDSEGFLYPEVEKQKCMQCGLCTKVCPMLSRAEKVPGEPLDCYAAVSKDREIRLKSSSGGVFPMFAKAILEGGGVVFGARFNERYEVIHSYTESEADLGPFLGSKYSQSNTSGVFRQVKTFLKEGREVLFTGTPCQISGLRTFLQDGSYDGQLFLVSVVCHGVPSPDVWKEYLASFSKQKHLTEVNMRCKNAGWNNYHIQIKAGQEVILDTKATDTPFMKAFLKNYILRPSCYSCKFRNNHGSDLTIGDYWGVEHFHPQFCDDLGTSLILVYTQNGKRLLEKAEVELVETRYENAISHNPSISCPPSMPTDRPRFWNQWHKKGTKALDQYVAPRRTVRDLAHALVCRIKNISN